MELRIKDLVAGINYKFISPISGEPGLGFVWVEIRCEKKVYLYQDDEGDVSQCHPCSLTKFQEIIC